MRIILISALLLWLLPGCSSGNNEAADNALLLTLQKAGMQTRVSNSVLMASVRDKLTDPSMRTNAETVYPLMVRADSLGQLAIRRLKNWPITKGPADTLLPLMMMQLHDSLMQTGQGPTSPPLEDYTVDKAGGISFLKRFRAGITGLDRSLYVEQLRLEVAMMELNVLEQLHERTGTVVLDCTWPEAIWIQSSTVLLPGEMLVITGGVIFKGWNHSAIMSVNKKTAKVGDDGRAVISVKAPLKPGNYSVPVSLKFTDEDGKEMSFIKEIKYRVIDCTSADDVTKKSL